MASDPPPNPKIAYESDDIERPASTAPTANQLDYESPVSSEAHDPYAAWRHPAYRLYAASYILAVVGAQLQAVTILWEVYEKTKSALSLGLLGGIQVVPVILLALPAGQVADTFSRRHVLLVTQLLLAFWGVAMALLSALGHGWAYFVPMAYLVVLLNATTLTFARPARQSLVPQLVPSRDFSNAVTWNSSMFEISSITGPAIGGFLASRYPPISYGMNALMLLACFMFTFLLPPVPAPQPAGNGAKRASTFASLFDGVRFVFRTKLLLATMTLDMFAVLLGGATYLLPVFADRLGVGGTGYGWMRAAPALGAFLMAMLLAHRPPLKRAGRALLLAVAGFGAATIVFGFSENFWLSLAMLFLTGALDNISVVIRHSLVQLLTPDAMRGRVSAVNQVFIGSSNELGGLESGLVAAWLGPVFAVVSGGVGTILVVLGVSATWPQIRRFASLRDARPAES